MIGLRWIAWIIKSWRVDGIECHLRFFDIIIINCIFDIIIIIIIINIVFVVVVLMLQSHQVIVIVTSFGCCWYSEGIHSCSGITNLYDVDHGRYPSLVTWEFPGNRVLALAAHTQVPLYTEPFSNRFRYKTPSWFTTKPQQSINITLHHSPFTFNLFLWPDRWTAPTSPQCLTPHPPLLHPCRQYPTLSQPASLLNRDSRRYEDSVVQNSFTSTTVSHPWKPDGGMIPSHSGIIAGAIHKGRKYSSPSKYQTENSVVGAGHHYHYAT